MVSNEVILWKFTLKSMKFSQEETVVQTPKINELIHSVLQLKNLSKFTTTQTAETKILFIS